MSNNNYRETYEFWKNNTKDELLKIELENMSEQKIKENFSSSLDFGTAGLRGTINAGTNKINKLTISQATQAVAQYLIKHFDKPSVAIAYDNRKFSKEFAIMCAEIFAYNRVTVHIFKSLTPTPILSYVVRKYKLSAGVNITSSHNPKEYNGFKVINEKGAQIDSTQAAEIKSYLDNISPFEVGRCEFEVGMKYDYISYFDEKIIKKYINICKKYKFSRKKYDLKIIYTPLNGTGLVPMTYMFLKNRYTNVSIPISQEKPSSDFETCPYPNPEFQVAYEESLKLAQSFPADIIVATDPDCDRMGAMVLHNDKYEFLTGNQIGLLLLFYNFTSKKIKPNSFVVNTVVTSPISKILCQKFNVKCYQTLTGFKNISVKVDEALARKENFIFAYEESNGYMAHINIRDKDAISSTMLLIEMCAVYKKCGLTLLDVLNKIYELTGFLHEMNDAIYFNDIVKMQDTINNLRNNLPKEIAGEKVVKTIDYLQDETGIEKSNFICFKLKDNQQIIVRPSGTEPKLKFYVAAKDKEFAEKMLNHMKNAIH